MNSQGNQNWNEMIHPYVDGELDAKERAAFEAELEINTELSAQVEALVEIGNLLRVEVDAAADGTDFGNLWGQLEGELAGEEQAAIDPLVLQAFADGQLEPAELATVAVEVGQSATAAQELAAIAEIGNLLRTSVEAEANAVDFGQLWARIDAEVGHEFEEKNSLAQESNRVSGTTPGLFERLVVAIGGYRAVLASAATAAVVVLVLFPLLGNDGPDDTNKTEDLEIRVVHINEVRSDPGYAVTVDNADDGMAPVIYIRPESDAEGQEGGDDDLFDNPI